MWQGVSGCLTGGQWSSNTILSSFVGALSPSRQGSPSHDARPDSYEQWRGSPEGSQALTWQYGRVPPQPGISLWQEHRDYTELTQCPQRQLPRLGRTHFNCTRHHFSHPQKTSARLSELSWLTLQAGVPAEGDQNCPGLPHKGAQGRRRGAVFLKRGAPPRPGRE